MTAITVTPLALVAPWWAALVAWAAFAGMSAAFLLVRADNGGNGDPLGRFSEFGRGYVITSYSIHYTKLYEASALASSNIRRRVPSSAAGSKLQ